MKKQNQKLNLSVVIPCYNEEKVLSQTVETLEKFFYKHKEKFNYELIFVNDGSTDRTQNLLNFYGHKKIKYYASRENFGKGNAVKKGLVMANYNTIMLLDCDLSVRPTEILSLYHYLLDKQWKQCVNDNFIFKGQRIQVEKQPIHRIIAGKFFQLFHKLWLNLPVTDSQCPFWIFYNINTDLFYDLKTDGFAFDCEILYKAKKKKIAIFPTPVDYFNEPDSRVTLYKTIKMFFELIKIKFL